MRLRKIEREDNARTWHWPSGGNLRLGRLKLGVTVHKHTYAMHSDRWVIKPSFVYDRKRKRTWKRDKR